MPIYDYVCTVCGTRVEVIHGVHEAGPALCLECGGAMRKALSPPAIVFRGSGWAKKDARAGSSGSARGSNRSDEQAADKAADKPADAKKHSGAPADKPSPAKTKHDD
jgi:putative FmdB family regulatory protein